MKPDWKDAPAWANWLAMDSDGEWYWYALEPSIMEGVWDAVGRIQRAWCVSDLSPILEKRP